MVAFPGVLICLPTPRALTGLGPAALRFCLLGMFMILSACGGGSGGGSRDAGADSASAVFVIYDVLGTPISDALITLGSGGDQQEARTDSAGHASFSGVRRGNLDFSVAAQGFETTTGLAELDSRSNPAVEVSLVASDAWAVPRMVVFGTQMLDRASDGSAMTFSTEVAVIDKASEALETLTNAHFSLSGFECGWGGPRDCGSDADGNDTGAIWFESELPLDFALLPPAQSNHFVADVLVELSESVSDWDSLKSFFGTVSNSHLVSLSSVRQTAAAEVVAVHGPFTSDGAAYSAAIDQLADPAGNPPAMLDSLIQSIQRVAAVDELPEAGRMVVVASYSGFGLTVAELNAAVSRARELGVKVSQVGRANYGFPELAMRTGGFSVEIDDPRQRAFVFKAMGDMIAGDTARYRMTFRILGDPGTFVSGGNAKVVLSLANTTSIRHNGSWTTLDVAIP